MTPPVLDAESLPAVDSGDVMTELLNDPDFVRLLAGVREDPADDTRRLVMADRLDELGEGGAAELIRVQVQISGMAYRPACDHRQGGCRGCKWWRLRNRLCNRRDSLLAGMCPWENSHGFYSVRDGMVITGPGELPTHWRRFDRGLLDQVSCPLSSWLMHGSDVVREPFAAVTAVRFPDIHPFVLHGVSIRGGESVRDGPDEWRFVSYDCDRMPWGRQLFADEWGSEAEALDALSDFAIAHAWESEPVPAG